MKNRSLFALLVSLFVVSFAVGLACSPPEDEDNPDASAVEKEALAIVAAPLDAAHLRVIQECSQAMVGSHDTYNVGNWPTGTTYATYAYVSSDSGAWNKLLDSTYGCTRNSGGACITPWTRGWWTSCRSTNSVLNYTPCNETYGNLNVASQFDCQGTCTSSSRHRGGQCKSFINLVAYRSGIYQYSGYGFRVLPNDLCITNTTASCNSSKPIARPANDPDMPLATYANIVEGDFLRKPNGHAVIVVRKVNSSTVIVLDSNWTGGDGSEIISSHQMNFGQGNSSDLSAYRVLKCIYTGRC